MVKKIISKLANFFGHRSRILVFTFLLMSGILLFRLLKLQIVNGKQYAENFTVMTTRKRILPSTRGNIYDVNGKLLAYNKLSNSVTIEDNGSYASVREKNLALNSEILKLTSLIQSKNDVLSHDFHIFINEDGQFAFDVDEGRTRDRFRADIFGYKKIEDMKESEANASADEIMSYLSGEKRFALYNQKNPYSAEELKKYDLPEQFTNAQLLNVVIVRYQLSLISYQRYVPVTVAENVSDATVAAVTENQSAFQGVSIEENSRRVYNDAESLAPVIG